MSAKIAKKVDCERTAVLMGDGVGRGMGITGRRGGRSRPFIWSPSATVITPTPRADPMLVDGRFELSCRPTDDALAVVPSRGVVYRDPTPQTVTGSGFKDECIRLK